MDLSLKRTSYPIYQNGVRAWIALLLVFIYCFTPLLGLPGWAEGPEVAVLLQGNRSSDTGSVTRSPSEDSLLYTLKQVNSNFTTIQTKELTNFKGKAVIVPLMDETSKTFLEDVLQAKGQNLHFILMPMLSQPNAPVENLLKSFGYEIQGSHYLPRSLPLKSRGRQMSTYIPIGSYVLKVSSGTPPLATWGDNVPAALAGNKSMLLNWNWALRFSPLDFDNLLAQWQAMDKTLALSGNAYSNTGNALTHDILPNPALMAVPDAQAKMEPPKPVTKPAPVKITEVPKPSQAVEKPATPPAKATVQPQSPSPVATSPDVSKATPAPSQPSTLRPVDTPRTQTATLTPTAPLQPKTQKATEVSETESYPEEMYEFDDGGPKERAGLRRSARTQEAMAEFYNDRMRELAELQDKVNLLAGQYMSHPEKYEQIRKIIDAAALEKSKFETAWFQQNFGPALASFEESKTILMSALFDKVPGTQIEGRAIWLDRGSIVQAGSEQALRQLIRRITASGFNVIYFETVNAGYPIYPSTIVEQNPSTKGWDPLAVAVDEAHKNGIELHAWVWVFAVGNKRHNKILEQPMDYPGPILSRADMASEALRGRSGELVPAGQHEYWLSPASTRAREFLISLFTEIVKNYEVDGLQLDYIRYPFQKPSVPMGLESVAMKRFNSETGLDLGAPNDYTAKAWSAWKAFQVTTFVKDLSNRLKAIKPDLKLSAAVFPMARHSRMLAIQQDWETWVRNGWIDTLNPMAYSRSPRSLERLVQYIHNISDDKTLVYPGLSLQKLNAIELLDTLEICRRTGVMGTTLFAVTQFDDDKQMVLQTGPYKQRRTIPPHRDPLGASAKLVAEAQIMVDSLLKSDQPKPGMENLKGIQESLKSVSDNIAKLNGGKQDNFSSGYILTSIRDDSRLLQQRADQWNERNEDSVTGYQAKVLKQTVDKVVRMVNYATFQLSAGHRQNGSFLESTGSGSTFVQSFQDPKPSQATAAPSSR